MKFEACLSCVNRDLDPEQCDICVNADCYEAPDIEDEVENLSYDEFLNRYQDDLL
jgi:hypothetical protein